MTSRRPSGFSLVELIVAIAIMGIAATLATVAFRALARPAPESWERTRREARLRAVEEGRQVVVASDSTPAAPVLFLPDGRVVGEDMDALSGRSVRP